MLRYSAFDIRHYFNNTGNFIYFVLQLELRFSTLKARNSIRLRCAMPDKQPRVQAAKQSKPRVGDSERAKQRASVPPFQGFISLSSIFPGLTPWAVLSRAFSAGNRFLAHNALTRASDCSRYFISSVCRSIRVESTTPWEVWNRTWDNDSLSHRRAPPSIPQHRL